MSGDELGALNEVYALRSAYHASQGMYYHAKESVGAERAKDLLRRKA